MLCVPILILRKRDCYGSFINFRSTRSKTEILICDEQCIECDWHGIKQSWSEQKKRQSVYIHINLKKKDRV